MDIERGGRSARLCNNLCGVRLQVRRSSICYVRYWDLENAGRITIYSSSHIAQNKKGNGKGLRNPGGIYSIVKALDCRCIGIEMSPFIFISIPKNGHLESPGT